MMKRIALVSVLASTMLLNTACDDREIAAGIIGVGIGIGVSAGSGGHYDRDRDYDRGRRHGDYRRGDHRGGRHHRPPPRYGHPGRGHWSLASATDPTAGSANQEFADRYQLSPQAAVKIQTAFDQVESKGMKSFEAVGLSEKDLRTIAKKELPSSSALKVMAARLDISEAQSRDLVKDMIEEFEAQAADIESPYWQSCMAKGKWRTDDNLYCKKSSWSGCSPDNGAKLCY